MSTVAGIDSASVHLFQMFSRAESGGAGIDFIYFNIWADKVSCFLIQRVHAGMSCCWVCSEKSGLSNLQIPLLLFPLGVACIRSWLALTQLEENVIRPLPHTWAHRRWDLWLTGETVCPSHIDDTVSLALSGFDPVTSWDRFQLRRVSSLLLL